MKLNIVDLMESTSAVKKAPSKDKVQKAKEVLKSAQTARAEKIKTKLVDLIGKAKALDSQHSADNKLLAAQVEKQRLAMQRTIEKLNKTAAKTEAKVMALVPRMNKLQDMYLQAGGKDIMPDFLYPYIDSANKARADGKKPVARTSEGPRAKATKPADAVKARHPLNAKTKPSARISDGPRAKAAKPADAKKVRKTAK